MQILLEMDQDLRFWRKCRCLHVIDNYFLLVLYPLSLFCQGHDCCPYQFTYKGPGALEFVKKLDIPKQSSKGGLSAMQLFQNLDKRASEEESIELKTLHQNSIT